MNKKIFVLSLIAFTVFGSMKAPYVDILIKNRSNKTIKLIPYNNYYGSINKTKPATLKSKKETKKRIEYPTGKKHKAAIAWTTDSNALKADWYETPAWSGVYQYHINNENKYKKGPSWYKMYGKKFTANFLKFFDKQLVNTRQWPILENSTGYLERAFFDKGFSNKEIDKIINIIENVMQTANKTQPQGFDLDKSIEVITRYIKQDVIKKDASGEIQYPR